MHVHPTQGEFILVLDGMLDLKLDGVGTTPSRRPHPNATRHPARLFQQVGKPARVFWDVLPARKLEALFAKLDKLDDIPRIVQLSAEHEVSFCLPRQIAEHALPTKPRAI